MIIINNPADCCGCTACASACRKEAISMRSDAEGFLYPFVDMEKCNNCGLCENVCPIIKRKELQNGASIETPLDYLAVRIRDKRVLDNSSSGGAFTLLSNYVLEQNGIICGVEYSDTGFVQHSFAKNEKELERFRGSKYVQSKLDGIFAQIKEMLQNEKWVLFSGTPCQVDGLRSFLKKDYPTLITVDLVCHSIPSPLIYKEYLDYCSKKLRRRVVSIDMRYKKTYGWSHRFSYRYCFKNGKSITDPIHLANWGRLFFSEMINRPSCGTCQYTNLNRSGDFTIADFWDDNHKRPDIYSKEGTSLLLINTEKGEWMFEQVKSQSYYWILTKEEALQPCLVGPTIQSNNREAFWKFYHSYGFEETYKKYFAISNYVIAKQIIKKLLKNIHLMKE